MGAEAFQEGRASEQWALASCPRPFFVLPGSASLMAKIRTLKGEFFRNADISRGGPIAKLLAAGLVCAVADDEGRFKAALPYLQGEIFTHDQVDEASIDSAMQHLEAIGFIRLYLHNRGRIGAVLTWSEHQSVPKRWFKESKFPAPPNTRIHRITRTVSDAGKERKGGERRGEERNISVTTSPHSASAEAALVLQSEVSVSPAVQVFRAWIVSTGRSDRTLLDAKRQRLIMRALAGYELEDVLDAVDGWRFDAHHRGENDRGRPYNDLGLILRDPEHIERFRDFKRRPASVVIPAGKPSMSAFYRDQAAKHAEAGD